MRIGIDVGGTNTDAVLMNGLDVLGWRKRPNSTTGATSPIQPLPALHVHGVWGLFL